MLKTAFVFPGQGSQTVGMLADFLPEYPQINDVFMEVSDIVGYDVWELIQTGPAELLNQTTHTQVAMLTADVALFRLFQHFFKHDITVMAGHSLGEYAALTCSNALSLADAARLVARRAQLMQEAVPIGKGAMAAIVGLTDAQVENICADLRMQGQLVMPANYNTVGQIVIAGETDAVDEAIKQADEMGARMAKKLPMSVPSHCTLLTDAAQLFAIDLDAISFSVPECLVISNADISVYSSADQIKQQLTAQLYSPVRWVETIRYIKMQDVELLVECGPGKVLTGLAKRIDPTLRTVNTHDVTQFKLALAACGKDIK